MQGSDQVSHSNVCKPKTKRDTLMCDPPYKAIPFISRSISQLSMSNKKSSKSKTNWGPTKNFKWFNFLQLQSFHWIHVSALCWTNLKKLMIHIEDIHSSIFFMIVYFLCILTNMGFQKFFIKRPSTVKHYIFWSLM